MALARDLGCEVEERLLGRDVLYLADEVLLVGTAAEVTPVREIDGRIIGSGQPGPITLALQQAFDAEVRGAGRHPEWLTGYQFAQPEIRHVA